MDSSKIVMKITGIGFSILILGLLAFGLYRVGVVSYNFGYRVFTEPAVDLPEEGKDKVIEVKPGMGDRELGKLLEEKGLIRSANLFVLQMKLSAYAKTVKEGIYTLSTSMTVHEMLQAMSAEEEESTETEQMTVWPKSLYLMGDPLEFFDWQGGRTW